MASQDSESRVAGATASPGGATPSPAARATTLVAIGALAGVASGFFGIGGGIVIVSGLTLALRFPIKVAIACSLVTVLPLALVGGATHLLADARSVDWAAVAVLAAGSIVGARIGTAVRARLPDWWLKKAFALLLVAAAVRIFAGTPPPSEAPFEHVGGLIVIGLVAGVASSLLGIGGGLIMVPAMVLGWGLPIAPGADPAATALTSATGASASAAGATATGATAGVSAASASSVAATGAGYDWRMAAGAFAVPTSLATIVPTSLAGVIFQRRLKSVDASTVMLLVPAGCIAGALGALLLQGIRSPDAVRVAFGVLLCLVALRGLAERKRKPVAS